jgi:uncharacterized membrane protein YbhN (UPF0104 family)
MSVMPEAAVMKAELAAPEGRRSWMVAFVGAALFVLALLVLQRELSAFRYHELTGALFEMPSGRVVLALLLTAANYLILAGYDIAAFAWAGLALSRRRVAAVSLLSYAIAHSVGIGMLSGASVRYRFYTRWGVRAADLSRVVLFYSTTSLVGFLTLGGLSLALAPLPALAALPGPARAAGIAILIVMGAYAVLASTRRQPAASMSRSRSNCRVTVVEPCVLVEVICVTPAMRPNWRSSGVATEDAIVSGLAPGNPA